MLSNVRDEHDAVASGDPEQRDEADDRRDRQDTARQVDADDTSNQGERQVHQDVRAKKS
jgi:hypothetical protein